ncbi:polymer-forming cytoskeletal protein [Marispirochaeta sp.]|jgi:cytoskeletal protein CcmA (bactofilin family)|uniref:bactofilin family protein n=1 Tax=Marispirochaeta sp. TaxID=2038653 RepID=UPI0029C6555C|nr:polymer-forming cytoskeletal protein [Marispirochaeta sp.]
MSDVIGADSAFINSFIGEGTRFEGNLSLSGLLRIDGDFLGTIATEGKVLIGKTGRVEGSVSAKTVVVGGTVKGDISCTEKLVILSSGLMLGNVRSPRLIVEEGVIINGECRISGDRDISVDTPDAAAYQPFGTARK